MANVFFAWELGANLGHIGSFLPLALLLRERGHSVHWALAKTHEAAGLLRPHGFSWMPAPTSHDHLPGRAPENYGSILLHFGYGRPQTLLGLVEGWRSLMQLSGADVVVVDHAPTAILAARTLGLPVMNHGNGFTLPPPAHPTPAFRSWVPLPQDLLMANDVAALTSINRVVGEYGGASLATLAELFKINEPALMTFPELDHYAARGPARYWGVTPSVSGEAPQWPDAPGPKVFAYVRASGKHYRAVLEALAQMQACVLVVAPGLAPEEMARFQCPNLNISTNSVNLSQAANESAMGVMWSGGGNTTLAFLLAGKPLVLLPNQIEPYMQGLRAQQMGAGLVADLDAGLEVLPQLLQKGIGDSNLAANARAFASRYASVSGQQRLEGIAARVDELIAGHQRAR